LKVQNAGDPPESEDEEGAINDDQEKGSSSKKTDDDQSKNSSGPAGLTDANIEVLRGKFPILRELSSGFIKGLTPTELMNLEKASMKRGQAEQFKDAEDKLTTNRQDLGQSATDVKAGVDDRWTRLHDGRFLGGAGCAAATLWLTARERIELEGHPPISTYDMACMGLAGYITPRGWIEVSYEVSHDDGDALEFQCGGPGRVPDQLQVLQGGHRGPRQAGLDPHPVRGLHHQEEFLEVAQQGAVHHGWRDEEFLECVLLGETVVPAHQEEGSRQQVRQGHGHQGEVCVCGHLLPLEQGPVQQGGRILHLQDGNRPPPHVRHEDRQGRSF
jgi:hypothetical protein